LEVTTYGVEQVLLGSLLGDGSLEKSNVNPRYIEAHALPQREYLEWKNTFFNGNYCIREMKSHGKTRPYAYLRTHVDPSLLPYYRLVYPNGKKTVTMELLDRLEQLGMAIWYCDDGTFHYRDNTITLSTNCFSYEEYKIIKKWFDRRWGINVNIFRHKDSYVTNLSPQYTREFLMLIKPVFPPCPCMYYKLGYLCIDNWDKLLLSNKNKRDYNKKYRKNNSDKIARQKRLWYCNNRDKILEMKRSPENRKRERENRRKRKLMLINSNPEEYQKVVNAKKKSNREYYATNRDRILEQKRDYYKRNRERILQYERKKYSMKYKVKL